MSGHALLWRSCVALHYSFLRDSRPGLFTKVGRVLNRGQLLAGERARAIDCLTLSSFFLCVAAAPERLQGLGVSVGVGLQQDSPPRAGESHDGNCICRSRAGPGWCGVADLRTRYRGQLIKMDGGDADTDLIGLELPSRLAGAVERLWSR